MLTTGLLLTAGVVLLFVESFGYRRGGFDSAFWQQPLENQLDRIAEKSKEWSWVALWSQIALFLMTGGVAALAFQLAEAGEAALAFAGFGIYLVAMAGWAFGSAISYAGMSSAAKGRDETGAAPSWMSPLGAIGYVAEASWILGANVAYAILGAAVLSTGLLPAWSGWAAVGVAVAIVLIVAISRVGFPQMGDLVPFILGIAAILEVI